MKQVKANLIEFVVDVVRIYFKHYPDTHLEDGKVVLLL
jgi:hypothetical protein